MNGSQSIHSYFETIPKNDGKNDPIRPEMQKNFNNSIQAKGGLKYSMDFSTNF